MTTDYSTYAEPTSSDTLAQLSLLAEQQLKLENKVAEAEKALSAAQEELRLMCEKTLPELMDTVGMEEFTTRSGLKIKVAEAIRASIPKARSDEAIAWLDNHGFANLVKRKFTVLFGKEEEAWAKKFARDLAQRKRQLNVEEDASVHNRTLCAFIREQLEQGQDIPVDLFGVFRQRVTKVGVK